MAKKVAALRSALLNAVTEDDIRLVGEALVNRAKAGEIAAIRELLDRLLGRPLEADLLDRLEAMEEAVRAENKP